MNMNIQRKFEILSECSGADPTRPNNFDLNLQIVANDSDHLETVSKETFQSVKSSHYVDTNFVSQQRAHAITASLPQNLSQITRYPTLFNFQAQL